MSRKIIITIFCFLLASSFITLAFIEKRAMDPDAGKNWWVTAFSDPHGDTTDFFIENHSESTDFAYEIRHDGNPAERQSLTLPKGSAKEIRINSSSQPGTKTTITVWHGSEKREIYK